MQIKHLYRIGLLFALLSMGSAAHAEEPASAVVPYAVSFKGKIVATQIVHFVRTGDRTSIETGFEASLPVFVAQHLYREKFSITYREDGTVETFKASITDGRQQREVTGEAGKHGDLEIRFTGTDGSRTNLIARADYDFNTLALYGTNPSVFLPTNQPARVLDPGRGEVVLFNIQVIDESSTFERQYLPTKHLVWTEGLHTSHSWHPEKFNDFPRRYVRQTGAGEFVFQLVR